jgi:hypothetical protein
MKVKLTSFATYMMTTLTSTRSISVFRFEQHGPGIQMYTQN